MLKLTAKDRRAIVRAYRDGEKVSVIARRYGISRQHVNNVRRAKLERRSYWVERPCAHCGRPVRRRRAQAKRTRNSFCNGRCYAAHLHNPSYIASRRGMRLAREYVMFWFHLQERHVVHHVDGDENNNNSFNLMVFANHADHMRWHRAGGEKSGAVPLWRGDRAVPIELIR